MTTLSIAPTTRLRRRHYDVLRALLPGPVDASTLARRVDCTVGVALQRASECGGLVENDGRLLRITDAGRDLLTYGRAT